MLYLGNLVRDHFPPNLRACVVRHHFVVFIFIISLTHHFLSFTLITCVTRHDFVFSDPAAEVERVTAECIPDGFSAF